MRLRWASGSMLKGRLISKKTSGSFHTYQLLHGLYILNFILCIAERLPPLYVNEATLLHRFIRLLATL
jgi:hypothetical protein